MAVLSRTRWAPKAASSFSRVQRARKAWGRAARWGRDAAPQPRDYSSATPLPLPVLTELSVTPRRMTGLEKANLGESTAPASAPTPRLPRGPPLQPPYTPVSVPGFLPGAPAPALGPPVPSPRDPLSGQRPPVPLQEEGVGEGGVGPLHRAPLLLRHRAHQPATGGSFRHRDRPLHRDRPCPPLRPYQPPSGGSPQPAGRAQASGSSSESSRRTPAMWSGTSAGTGTAADHASRQAPRPALAPCTAIGRLGYG